MSIVAQQVVVPKVCDPNNVSETLANGPINMNVLGNLVTFTFTHVRLDVGKLFEGQFDVNKLSAIVVARVTIPMEQLVQLKTMLEQSVVEMPTGTTKQ
jgi:hypothetical protein